MSITDVINAVLGTLTALGTLAAVGVAVWAVRRESAARDRAEQRASAAESARICDSEQRAERDLVAAQRHQAERVVAWAEWVTERAMLDGSEHGHWKLLLANASDLPAFDVTIIAVTPDGSWQYRATDPVLPPGSTRWVKADRGTGNRRDVTRPGVGVRFRDAGGRWWLRSPAGVLELEQVED